MKINVLKYENKDIIHIIREWTQLNQKDFAKSINVSINTIQSYEANRRVYNINILKKIAKAHNLDIVIKRKDVH